MTARLEGVAQRLFAGVMAPLVLGGPLEPTRAIGARAALALGATRPAAADLAARVHGARVRRARTLVPIDHLGPPSGAEWALAAALHDLVHAANPGFDAPLRRGGAALILELAGATIRRVAPPQNLHEAVSRHTWFARLFDIARTDTAVSWWSGSRVFLGVEPPARLRAWPEMRRVHVTRTPVPLLELEPLAVGRAALTGAVAALLARTPLTDLATCTRAAPAFSWNEATLALLQRPAGRTLVMRALARLSPADVDVALGRASRAAIAGTRSLAPSALALLADRAIARAHGHVVADIVLPHVATGPSSLADEAAFARSLGAAAALRALSAPGSAWSHAELHALRDALAPAARQASALLGHAL
jgi:hypothetical protein